MATITVTKVSVGKVMSKMFAITLKLTVEDGEQTLLEKEFTQNHKIGNTPAYTVNRFKRRMQAAIDDYQAEQAILTAAALDNAITALEGGLTWQ